MSKIAICGKGGVGKTTFTALLACVFTETGQDVYAIDADPNPCLAEALGFPQELVRQLHPISEMLELIAERTGAKPGEYGSFFKLNPRVSDIPKRFSVTYRNIHLLQMGSVRGAGKGCACPENAMLKALVTHLLLREKDSVLLDMVAGIEHLGRGTARAVDAMMIIVEPGTRSWQTARDIAGMARDLGISKLWAVGNKVRGEEDKVSITEQLPDLPIAGWFPFSDKVIEADLHRRTVIDAVPDLLIRTREIARRVLQ
jgi:CO dehydrogenase maturation factor